MIGRLTGYEFETITSSRCSVENDCERLFIQRLIEYFLQSDDAKKPYNLSNYNSDNVLSLIVSNTDVSEITLHDFMASNNQYQFKTLKGINVYRYLEDPDGYITALVEENYEANKTMLRHAQVILNQVKKDYEKLKRNIQHPIWKKAEMIPCHS